MSWAAIGSAVIAGAASYMASKNSKGGSSSSSSSSQPWSGIKPFITSNSQPNGLYQQAQSLLGGSAAVYPGQTVAGFTDPQLAAQQMTVTRASQGNQAMNAAQTFATGLISGETSNDNTVNNQYMNGLDTTAQIGSLNPFTSATTDISRLNPFLNASTDMSNLNSAYGQNTDMGNLNQMYGQNTNTGSLSNYLNPNIDTSALQKNMGQNTDMSGMMKYLGQNTNTGNLGNFTTSNTDTGAMQSYLGQQGMTPQALNDYASGKYLDVRQNPMFQKAMQEGVGGQGKQAASAGRYGSAMAGYGMGEAASNAYAQTYLPQQQLQMQAANQLSSLSQQDLARNSGLAQSLAGISANDLSRQAGVAGQMAGFNQADLARNSGLAQSMASMNANDLSRQAGIAGQLAGYDLSGKQLGAQTANQLAGYNQADLARNTGIAQQQASFNQADLSRNADIAQQQAGFNQADLAMRYGAAQNMTNASAADLTRQQGAASNIATIQAQNQSLQAQQAQYMTGLANQNQQNAYSRQMDAMAMAPIFAQNDYVDINAMNSVGMEQQAQQQRLLDAARVKFEAQDPYRQQLAGLNNYASLLGQGGQYSNTTTTGPSGQPNAMMTGLGTGMNALGLYIRGSQAGLWGNPPPPQQTVTQQPNYNLNDN